MTRPSRRKLLASVMAVPVLVRASPSASPLRLPGFRNTDDLTVQAAQWIVTEERVAAMQLKWQVFEGLLFDKARWMKMSCEMACRSDLPEAQAMRTLDSEIEATRRWLDASAQEIRITPATTVAGAIAKIELGLKVQGPYDWQDHARELLEDGIAELRSFLNA
jgi:hypothetical protein